MLPTVTTEPVGVALPPVGDDGGDTWVDSEILAVLLSITERDEVDDVEKERVSVGDADGDAV